MKPSWIYSRNPKDVYFKWDATSATWQGNEANISKHSDLKKKEDLILGAQNKSRVKRFIH